MARAGNSFAGRRVLGWIPACAGMTDCGRVPDPLAKKQPMTFRSSFPTARGYAGPPEEANVIPAEAGIQSGWLGALSRSSRYTVRRPSGGRHSMTAVRARRLPVVEWLMSAREGDVSRRTGTVHTSRRKVNRRAGLLDTALGLRPPAARRPAWGHPLSAESTRLRPRTEVEAPRAHSCAPGALSFETRETRCFGTRSPPARTSARPYRPRPPD